MRASGSEGGSVVHGGDGGGELGVFKGRVPVPMEWPGREFSGDLTPWFSQEG